MLYGYDKEAEQVIITDSDCNFNLTLPYAELMKCVAFVTKVREKGGKQ